jgi:hypothetical protein
MFRRIFNSNVPRRAFAVRKMGGGHHAPPTEGLDGIVRKYLPQDYQV